MHIEGIQSSIISVQRQGEKKNIYMYCLGDHYHFDSLTYIHAEQLHN